MSHAPKNDVSLPEERFLNVLDDQNSSVNAPIDPSEVLEGSQLHDTVSPTSVSSKGCDRGAKSKAPLSILKQATDRRQGQQKSKAPLSILKQATDRRLGEQRQPSQQHLPLGCPSRLESSSSMGSGPHNLTPRDENIYPPQLPSPTPRLHSTTSHQKPSGSQHPPIKRPGLGLDGGAGERQAPAASLGGTPKTRASRRRLAWKSTPKHGLSLDPEDQGMEDIRVGMGRMDMGNNKKDHVSDKKGRPNPGIASTLATVSKPNVTARRTENTAQGGGKQETNFLVPKHGSAFARKARSHNKGRPYSIDRPFVCDRCQKPFAELGYLGWHLKECASDAGTG